MKVRGKKLLAAMLSLAMVLSMFTVPASAAEIQAKEWKLNDATAWTDNNETGKTKLEGTTGTLDGLEIDATNGKWDGTRLGGWPQVNTGTIIKVPVTVPEGQKAIVTINPYNANAFTVDGTANTKAQENEEFTCAGTDGYVTIEATANSYLGYIAVRYAEAELQPTLSLNKESVAVEKGKTADVTATVANATATKIEASSDTEAVATASCNNSVVTINAVSKGTATITVTATLEDGSTLEKTIAVTVEEPLTGAVGDVWAFKSGDILTGITSFKGLTLTNVSHENGKNHAVLGNGSKITVPVAEKCNVVVTAYYQAAATVGDTPISIEKNGPSQDFTYSYTSEAAGTVDITATGTTYISKITITAAAVDPEPDPEPGNGKVDVYDFGAEQLDETKFNNKLTADIINAWYPGVAAGTASTALPASVTTGNFTAEFNGTSTRLRTSNTALTRYDSTNNRCDLSAGQDPYDSARTNYAGVICSNGNTVTLKLKTGVGDKITYIMGANAATAYTTVFTGVDGSKKEVEVPATHAAVTFYAPKAGTQSLFSGVDGGVRPAVARIYVEQPTAVTVSGSLDATALTAADAAKVKLVFTNDDNGMATEAAINGSTYTVALNNYQAGATYTVTAEGVTGGIVTVGDTLAFAKDTAITAATHDVTVGQVNLVNVSGPITGMSADADSLVRLKLTLTPPEGNIYVPKITLNSAAWSAQLQSGIEYAVTAENVNDYTLDTGTVKYDADATNAAIAFTAKPTYAVTIVPTGLTLDDLADATFIFTNVSETYEGANGKPASYSYSFTGTDGIQLRDGQYTVKADTTKGRQELTPDLKVEGTAVNCPIGFNVEAPTEWDFRVANAAAMTEAAKGLTLTGVGYHGAQYGSNATGGTYGIPVAGPCTIKVSVGYNWDVYMPEAKEHNTAASSYKDKTNSGDKDVEFVYEGEAGTVTLTTGAEFTSYVKAIKVIPTVSVDFQDTVTVGEGKDCATITEALELVGKMPRPNGERVTIVIDPGDYEEQLRVDVPNVTLKNAKASAAKLELKNKGVDIGDDEVRVTHYYGHGYTYYSMTNGHRYDEKVLAVNKANGYPSYINKGSGSTDSSYWNASVVVTADGFQAEGIIFENSFNQYVSAKAANDVIVPQTGAAKEPADAPRASLPQGSTDVQYKTYVERAAAMAITGDQAVFDNCAFIGRQDTLYGGENTTAAFYNCDVYGGTDFIMGGMNAVFAKCDLVMNTSENNNDVAYITAGQHKSSSSRGYLMYNCSVISTVPGVNTASALPSKPGTFGRPWEANCEVIFYETVVGSTTTTDRGTQGTEEVSLIQPIGWTEGLNGGGHFERCGEYHTHESANVDNSASRHTNANVFTEPKLADGTAIDYETWLGGWKPFEGKDMSVLSPDTSRTVTFQISSGASVTDLAADGKAATLNSKNQLLALKEAVVTFKIGVTEGYTLSKVTGATWDDESVYTVTADTVVINATRNHTGGGGGGDNVPSSSGGKTQTVTNPDGSKTTTKTDRKGNVTVTTKATDGSQVVAYTTKDGDKTITVTDAKGNVQAKVELPAAIPAPEKAFTDVPEGHWAEGAIHNMAGLGTVKGVSDGVFDMSSPITRGSVATILYRLSNVESKGDNAFTDVASGDWYAEAVTWAVATGVVTGYSENLFGPKDSIDRQQFAVMLYRYAQLLKLDTAAQAELKQFQDAADVADWANEAMVWCVDKGILKGNGYGGLNPAGTASRAECAVMLDRFIGLL